MSGTSKRSNDDKTKGTMEASGQSSNNASRVASPGSILQEMSRSGYVPGYPAPGSFPGFPGRSWQDIPPFLLRSFMPPVPLGMDMLSTAILLQGSSIYPTPNSLPMGPPLGLMQPPFNAPIFSSNDSLQSSSVSKSHGKQDPGIGSKQRVSKRTPSETNIYSQNLEQMVSQQKNKEVSEGLKHYSPVGYNSPRTKSNKSVEESIIIPGDDEPLDVIKISDDNSTPLALVTKKKSQAEFEDKLPPNLSCQGEQNHVILPPHLLHRDLDVEPGTSRKSATQVQSEEKQSSKAEASKAEVSFDQTPSEQEVPEQKTVVESDSSSLGSKLSIALPPRKRLTRNTEDIAEALPSTSVGVTFSCPSSAQLPATMMSANSMPSSDSPQSSNFRSCWKKFSAKINNHCPPVHRSYHAAGKPMYDCRAFFQKISGKDSCKPGVLIGKPYLSGNRFYHRARYTPRKEPQVQEGSSSPRITRSQARQKKVNAEESGNNGNVSAISEPQEVAPVRKSLRKKTSNSRYDAPDIVTPGIKTRKPRNSKKNQDDPKNAAGDSLNDSTFTTNAEKQSDESLDQTLKSRNDEIASTQDQTSSFERTPDKMINEDLPPVTPNLGSLATDELKVSVENRRIDNCDRKSTSSGLSTCSGDISFDPEFPVSLPPKFRHTKRKSNYIGFVSDDKSNETNSVTISTAEPSTSSSITCNLSTATASSAITTVSTALSFGTFADVPSTCAPSLPTGAIDNAVANVSLQSSKSANTVNRPENSGPSSGEQNKAGDASESTYVSEDASAGKISTSPRVHVRCCLEIFFLLDRIH